MDVCEPEISAHSLFQARTYSLNGQRGRRIYPIFKAVREALPRLPGEAFLRGYELTPGGKSLRGPGKECLTKKKKKKQQLQRATWELKISLQEI